MNDLNDFLQPPRNPMSSMVRPIPRAAPPLRPAAVRTRALVVDQKRIARAVREILIAMGEDPDREGLLETPARVAYLPAGGTVTGLSKLARTVDVFARRPQLQERLTAQIADALVEHLAPRGVAVLIEGEHMCLRVRGAKKSDAKMVTTALRGVYTEDRELRREVLALLRGAGE
jgi:GTP cyclohydrolase I